MEQQDFKDLTKIVSEIDKKMGILIQKNEDFCLMNSLEHKQMNDTIVKHNGRLSKLEKWRWMISGALILMSFLVGWTLSLINKII